MYHPADASVLYSAYRLFMDFTDEYGAIKGEKTGTCFFVSSNGRLFLVTNRHNLDAGYRDADKRNRKLTSLTVSGFDSKSHFFRGKLLDFIGPIFPSNRDEDVAILAPKGVVLESGATGPLSVRNIQREAIADLSFLSGFSASEFIVFPGYPRWHDRAEHRPIIRSGIVSSDPATNYTGPSDAPGARRIAFEGFSFDGSSGSPVFCLPFGLNAGPGISGISFRHQRLIGINMGHENDGRTGLHSGISRMIKSTVILELMDHMLANT